MRVAHGSTCATSAPGRDLELDPPVALRDVRRGDRRGLRRIVVSLDDDADRHTVARRAPRCVASERPRRPEPRVEQRHLERGLRHVVAGDLVERRPGEQARREVIADARAHAPSTCSGA